MADIKWIKITTDMFDNRKIKYLRKLPDGNSIVLIWVMLLTMAGRCNASGKIFLTETIPYTNEMLADELGFEPNLVKLALCSMEKLNMIIPDDGYIAITGWEEHQNEDAMEKIREQNRIRKQRQRENQKLLKNQSRDSHVTDDVIVTHSHATEEERDKEKETSSSFPRTREDGAENKKGENPVETLEKSFSCEALGGIGKNVVLLDDEQMEDLLDRLGVEDFNYYVGVVADCELHGKPYRKKTHYQAILDMAIQDGKIKKGRSKNG